MMKGVGGQVAKVFSPPLTNICTALDTTKFFKTHKDIMQ
jgi:hypothetical protein